MKVAVYYRNDDVRLEDRPVPTIGPGECLVRVRAVGICGTDVTEWYRLPRAPLVLGHEIAGEVVDVGPGVTHVRPGERVVVAHHVPCGICHYCTHGHATVCPTLQHSHLDPGGLAEYVRVPPLQTRFGLFTLPDHVTDPEGAMVEPLGCVLRGQRLIGLAPDHRVIVIGCGPAGMLHIVLAAATGVRLLAAVEPDAFRRSMAERLGASPVLDPNEPVVERLRSSWNGALADRVIVCTGAPAALHLAMACVAPGGTVLFFAPTDPERSVPIPFNRLFWRTEITLTSSYGAAPADMARALELIASRVVDVRPLITHRYPLQRVQEAFHRVCHPEASLKVIIELADH